MFSTQSDNCTPFVHIFDIVLSFAAELEEPKTGIPGKGLKPFVISSQLFEGNQSTYQCLPAVSFGRYFAQCSSLAIGGFPSNITIETDTGRLY